MFWYRILALIDSLQEGRFAATVLTEETVSAAVGEFESGIADEDSAVEDQGARSDLDISALLEGAENTSCNTIRETVLVHLVRQSLHFILPLCSRRLFTFGERISIGVEKRGGIVTGDRGGA